MGVLSRYRNRCALALAALLAITSAGCAKLPWPGSSADNNPPEASTTEPSQSGLADLQSMVAQDHQAIQQLAERNRQLEEEVRQLKEQTMAAPPAAATVPTNEGQMAAINQRLTKLESASTAVQSTLSRAIGRTVRSPRESAEEPVALPSYDALLDHEIGLTEGEHRQQLAEETYHEGLIALRGVRWATAIDKFESVVKRYPRSPLVEKSRYFSAIAYYEDGKYDSAIVKFRDFVNRYPRSRFTSTAMLNLALAYVQVKDQGNARATLKKVLADYPSTPEATIAQATLKTLDTGPGQAHQVNSASNQ